MYELARAGEEFEPPQRTVQVYEMELLEYVPGLQALVRVEISCSKGTYVRSLARMLGERLGCGAHLSALLRTRVGPHSLQDSILPEELPEAAADHLIGLAEGLPDMPRVVVSEEQAQRLAHGGAVPLAGAPPPPPTEPCAVLDPGGSLICIASLSAGRPAALEPRKVLV